ncbi:unnamed protein product [Adineta steineri]|uniref:Aprataxin and PNK-like factor n=1 Tax=Adineta steineri TaxID=433720 RepID=A0A814B8D4_9BILA|nr:unnamed protein product [Adineta steineri]CAF0923498.1 unnamed protein product [Adineta steineri]
MVGSVELIPIAEGTRITVKENEKVIVGRGSSLGCNEKKISRHHAELLLKDDGTLWITPTHANPVFFRPLNGKTIQLQKDIQRELKDGDQIGLLPSTFFFRVSFSTDVNNNNDRNDSDSDSLYECKKEEEEVDDDNDVKPAPIRSKSPDDWSPTHGYRRSISNQDVSVFDFDDDLIIQPTSTPPKRTPLEKKTTSDVEPKPRIVTPPPKRTPLEKKTTTDVEPKSRIITPSPTKAISRPTVPRPTISRPSVESEDEPEPMNTNDKIRKLPKWMVAPTPSPVVKQTTTTPKSSYSRSSSYTAPTSAKRHLSFEGESNDDLNESSNISDIRSPIETKSPGKVLSKIPAERSFDSDSGDGFDSVTPKTPPPPKKMKPGGKRRPICQFGATCYRKNPTHRAEHSHPGDDDYDESKKFNDMDDMDDNDADKPDCPFGKSCYRQNPQHKRDFKH